MPTYYASLPPDLAAWALAQPLFFTATAPTYGAHVNVSPKGHTGSSLAVLSSNSCAYLDATGSGCETAAHLRDNGRITLLWLSLGPSPRILRLFGVGRAIERGGCGARGSPAFERALQRMCDAAPGGALAPLPAQAGKGTDGARGWRAVVVVDFFKVQTSCGWGVPVMAGLPSEPPTGAAAPPPPPAPAADAPATVDDIRASVRQLAAADAADDAAAGAAVYKGPAYAPRATLANFMAVMGGGGGRRGAEYQARNGAVSLDGLPGYRSARRIRLTTGSLRLRLAHAAELGALAATNECRRLWGMRGGVALGLVLGLVLGMIMAVGVEGTAALIRAWADSAGQLMRERLR